MTNDRTKTVLVLLVLAAFAGSGSLYAQISGAIYTTNKDATAVNWNVYAAKTDVYISGGPQNLNSSGLTDGTYYFQVTDPSGKTLLSTDNAVCRQLVVIGGRVAGPIGPACKHANGTFNPDNGVLPVQLAPFSDTPNNGGEHKVWVVPTDKATVGADLKTLSFSNRDSKTDNFKVVPSIITVGSCQPSSSLSAMTSGTNVVSYVPKSNWGGSGSTGIAVVNVEGSATLPTTNPIPTADKINSCASNSTTGQTACTANNANLYKISGLSLTPTVTTLTSSGSGTIAFSGGSCTNCGVAMDGVHNKAVIGLSIASTPGFQFLNMATNTFEPAFASQTSSPKQISEDPLIDPIRNQLLNPTEANHYEIVNVATSTTPSFFENQVSAGGLGELDSAGADCQTGIILAPGEFSSPSHVFIANLSSSAATFTSGSPGTWTAPSQVQTLTESVLAAGATGIAVAQGTHIGIVTGEFGGNAITAIQLPSALDTSTAIPAIVDWVSCSISGFSNGFDPHAVTAYQSPNAPNHAIALLANGAGTSLWKVDLTAMLDTTIVPRTVGGHGCAAGTLPATVVSSLVVP